MFKNKKQLILNGEKYTYFSGLKLLTLLNYLGFSTNLIVVDYNGILLQKQFWSSTVLKDRDTIEILTIAGGG